MKKSNVMIITPAMADNVLNIPCTKVDFRSVPTNAGYVWFNIGSRADINWSYPLDIGELKKNVFVENINQLRFTFENPLDRIAVIYESEE